MDEVCLRVISFTHDLGCLERMKGKFLGVFADLPIENLQFHDFEPYWKIDGYGELNITFSADYLQLVEQIKTRLSNQWEKDVTDSRRAKIFCEDIHFIWLFGVGRVGGHISIQHAE